MEAPCCDVWRWHFFVLIRPAIYYLWKKRSQKRTDILLTGLCEAGKTVTFSQLLFNELRETFTSISENSGSYAIDDTGKEVQVIDIPGHERLRNRFVDQYKRTAKGIVYVVDSVNVQKDIRDVAEWVFKPLVIERETSARLAMPRGSMQFLLRMDSSFLYTLLADPATSSVPFLIACNKQDETLAKGSSVIRPLLEKELYVSNVRAMSATCVGCLTLAGYLLQESRPKFPPKSIEIGG